MSTRSQILFACGKSEKNRCFNSVEVGGKWYHNAVVYRHSDGYPDSEHGVLADLLPLLRKFKVARCWDPDYGAAHVVAEFIRLAKKDAKKYALDHKKRGGDPKYFSDPSYLGYGIEGFSGEFHGDVEYVYLVYPNYVEVLHGNELDSPLERRVDYSGKVYEGELC